MNPKTKEFIMYETNIEVALQHRQELEREAKNERLARSAQKEEKSNPLRNAVNKLLNRNDERNQS
jgi:hypothetical protein